MKKTHKNHFALNGVLVIAVSALCQHVWADCADIAAEIEVIEASLIDIAFDIDHATQTVTLINKYRSENSVSSFRSELFDASTQEVTSSKQRQRQQQTKLDQKKAAYEEEECD